MNSYIVEYMDRETVQVVASSFTADGAWVYFHGEPHEGPVAIYDAAQVLSVTKEVAE